MNPHDDNREAEMRRREQELKDREHALRLRELETEINQKYQPPLYETVKHQPSQTSLQQWSKQLVNVAKFMGIVVAVIVTIRIATWLTGVVIVAGVAWVAYKLFFEGDRARR